MLKKIIYVLIALFIMVPVLAGCGGGGDDSAPDTSNDSGIDPVTQLLEGRTLDPLSEKSQNYTVNLGYYNLKGGLYVLKMF